MQTYSFFIFFGKTYLQKPHCVMIENISKWQNTAKIFLKK